jgi:putative transcriptional regulator
MIKNRLKVLLAERDMNLSDLAEAAGIHYTTLRRFAGDGLTSIHKDTLAKVCKALDVQPGDVFIYKDDSHE